MTPFAAPRSRFVAAFLPQALLIALFAWTSDLRADPVEISELMASNVFTLDDREGTSADWLELHNTTGETVDVSGWYLTDNERDPLKWQIPAGVELAPDAYLVIFASSKDRDVAGSELHTSFQLSAGGEYLALVAADGETVVHEFAPLYPAQFQDISYGTPSGGGEPTYLAEPTPGAANSPPAAVGPALRSPAWAPRVPSADQDIVVTVRAAEVLGPVAAVVLTYRVGYATEADPIAMNDAGAGFDARAGDGVYTAVIPSSAFDAGDLVRWYFTATDAAGNASREPLFPDPRASPEYVGTVIADPDLDSSALSLHWFLAPGTQNAANSRSGTRAVLFFGGELYDNIFVRIRGGSTTGLPKKSYKFDFNPRHHFRFSVDAGRVSEINLNTNYTDKTHIRQDLAFEVFDAAGSPGCEAFAVRVNRDGAFFSVATLIEQPDDDLLRREGLDDRGALYKMFNTFNSATNRVEKKNRRWENNADLQAFIGSINGRTGAALMRSVFDRVDIPRVIAYLAANALTQNNDCMAKNYYLYRDTEGSGEWLFLPWDVDLSFGRHYMTNDNILGDLLWNDEDWVLGGRSRNVPISPSHPFMGKQELPGNRSWNRLIHALFEVPEFRSMFRRRLRTLMDEILQPTGTPGAELVLETRMAAMADELRADTALDLSRWGTFGTRRTIDEAIDDLTTQYLSIRRDHLFRTHLIDLVDDYPQPRAYSAEIPRAQSGDVSIEFGALDFHPASNDQDEEYIELVNSGSEAVDVSGWRVTGGVEHEFLPGTVILAGGSLHVSPNVARFRSRDESPRGNEGLFVQGPYAGHLSSFGEELCLESAAGDVVACVTYDGDPSVAQLHLRVTELHYHPAAPTAAEVGAGFVDQDEFEFIELRNTSEDTALDLDGVRFTAGIAFDFSSAAIRSLEPGALLIVVSDRAAFERRYGVGLPIAGEYRPTRLDNDGERIKLEDATNATIQEFTYNDNANAGWPVAADGIGHSLEVVDTDGDYDRPANWRASDAVHGSPGRHGDAGPIFVRGDANLDRELNVSDAVRVLAFLFRGGDLTCRDAADFDDDEQLVITDPIALLAYLFQGGGPPAPPYPAAGVDPTDDGALDCEAGL